MTVNLTPGTILKQRYHITREIGKGAMGIVYLARDLQENSNKAVKELNPAIINPRERKEFEMLFRREARILRNLKHRNLPAITEFFEENGRLYLIMEYIEGKSLLQILNDNSGPLDEAKVLEWSITICEILRYLHNQYPPIIFRDLKPSNIIETPDGTLKLVDFGIARYYHTHKSADTLNLGSPGYAAPEQYHGKVQSDARTDIYGLGVTMHVLLTDRDPSSTPFQFPGVASVNPRISAYTSNTVAQATLNDRLLRFPCAADMQFALKSSLKKLTGSPQAPKIAAGLLSPTPFVMPPAGSQGSVWSQRMQLITQHPGQLFSYFNANFHKAILVFIFSFFMFLPAAIAVMRSPCNPFVVLFFLAVVAGSFAFIAFFTS